MTNKIESIRLIHNISRTELSVLTGISIANLRNIEKNRTSIGLEQLMRISDSLMVPVQDLIINPDSNYLSFLVKSKNDITSIGQAIADNRKKLCLTQSQLAAMTGINRPQISCYEHGHRFMNIETLIKISKTLALASEEKKNAPK